MQLALPSTAMNAEAIQRLVPELFRVIAELEAAVPGRHFTPDGHLIGSIGEVIAETTDTQRCHHWAFRRGWPPSTTKKISHWITTFLQSWWFLSDFFPKYLRGWTKAPA